MKRNPIRFSPESPLCADGGLGTELIARGAEVQSCLDQLNVTSPDLVSEVHRSFAEAGSQIISTNTFGANRCNLRFHGLEDSQGLIIASGVGLARDAAPDAWIAGSVGPIREHLAPYGRVRKAEAIDSYRQHVALLAGEGVDLILIETQSDIAEMRIAVDAARAECDVPVVVCASFTSDDRTLLGSTPAVFATEMLKLGVDVIGVNCSEGPTQALRVLGSIARATPEAPLWFSPNAGGPERVGSRYVYPAAPEYFAPLAGSAVAVGAAVVGGCCGTGPAHIREVAAVIARREFRAPAQVVDMEPAPVTLGTSEPSQMSRLLAGTEKVFVVELEPPRGHAPEKMIAGAKTLARAGADALYVSDASRARLRMSAWAACRLIEEKAGVETVLGFPTRGRSLLRIQGDLLAAHALGIRNLFVCLGDPAALGDFPGADDRSGVAPTALMGTVSKGFNTGVDSSGESIGEATAFTVGCAVNLDPADIDRECRLLNRKIRAGASFALTQPFFEPGIVEKFSAAYRERHGDLEIALLIGSLPLYNARNAEYLHNEVPGISIPSEVRDRMRTAGDDGGATGRRIAVEVFEASRDLVGGVYVMPPFRRYDIAAELLETLRAL